jgi:hypothetical protein
MGYRGFVDFGAVDLECHGACEGIGKARIQGYYHFDDELGAQNFHYFLQHFGQ